jgi:hypothetical protein
VVHDASDPAGVHLSGSGGCFATGGELVVAEALVVGSTIERLAFDFDATCPPDISHPTWHASIRFNSTLPPRSPIASVVIDSDRPAPQGLGVPITLTATPQGGTGLLPIRYKWFVFDGSAWSALGEWNSEATLTWTPMAAIPNARIGVWARRGGVSTDLPEASAALPFPIRSTVVLSCNDPTPALGSTIAFTATAADGLAPYAFKWFVFDGQAWKIVRDWSADASLNWTAPSAGEYRVGVWIRSTGNTKDAPEASAAQPLLVTRSSVASVTLSADRVAPQLPGTTVTFAAATVAGTPPVQYRWWVYSPDHGWVVARDWGTTPTFSWTPATENAAYRVGVWARAADTAEGAAPDATASMPFAIERPHVASVAITADRPAPQAPGTSITFTAIPSGGTAPQHFKWFAYDGTAWTIVGDWNVSPTLTWTPSAANPDYRIGVWARSADSARDAADATASLSFAIAVPRVTDVTIASSLASPLLEGATVTFTASASGGIQPYEYKWLVFNGVAWTAVTAWSPGSTFAWTDSPVNPLRRVGVWVRSAGSLADAPEFAQSIAFSSSR